MMKIENELLHHLMASHQLAVIPNFYVKGFECDLFVLNKNLYTTEYEIKISGGDYKKDFGKLKRKYDWNTGRSDYGTSKHSLIEGGERTNRFYFVLPEGLIGSGKVGLNQDGEKNLMYTGRKLKVILH